MTKHYYKVGPPEILSTLATLLNVFSSHVKIFESAEKKIGLLIRYIFNKVWCSKKVTKHKLVLHSAPPNNDNERWKLKRLYENEAQLLK